MDSRRYPVLAAHPGAWLSYTVVLRNRSSRPFSFGRTCPAYEEGLSRQAAYILNCRAVGTIAPHAGVRFAMRFFIPPHLKTGDANTLAWTLAPHSWNAPVTQITLQVR